MGRLFVVATPIGNLEDFSPRAIQTLRSVQLIACEDTRHTGKLLNHFGIDTPTTAFHEHNEESKVPSLIERLLEGKDLALVSDAGTPLLSDPGFRLVSVCRDKGIDVVPIPGPFAGAAAVSVSGLPSDRITFLGFPPKKPGPLRKFLKESALYRSTLVFYISPHGLPKTLQIIHAILGDRRAFLIREMTKLYETSYHGTLSELVRLCEEEEARGEYTLVVEGVGGQRPEAVSIDPGTYVLGLMNRSGLTSREAIRRTSEELDLPRRSVYQAYLSAKGEMKGRDSLNSSISEKKEKR
jgi:16S rRNA (cytidine1402-2'-O)-methyltransferase